MVDKKSFAEVDDAILAAFHFSVQRLPCSKQLEIKCFVVDSH